MSDIREKLAECHQVKTITHDFTVLLDVLKDSDIDIDELAGQVSRNTAISARLLAVANSAWVSPRVPITSVQQACVLLGQTLVRSIGIALIVSAPFDPFRCRFFNSKKYWISAFLTADACHDLAINAFDLKKNDADSSLTIGLLHHIGLLALSDLEPEKTSEALQKALSQGLTVNDALIGQLGVGYSEAGHILLQSWRIPDMLSEAIERNALYAKKYSVDQVSILESARKVSKTLMLINESMFSKAQIPRLSDVEMLSFSKLEDSFDKTIELSEKLV
ncbi:MAG: HDOD domain-containing protein [Gammaproteobacteria bacterium]|nr:HDOD domain-containing protein [Gammaproteobacteria bacterium]